MSKRKQLRKGRISKSRARSRQNQNNSKFIRQAEAQSCAINDQEVLWVSAPLTEAADELCFMANCHDGIDLPADGANVEERVRPPNPTGVGESSAPFSLAAVVDLGAPWLIPGCAIEFRICLRVSPLSADGRDDELEAAGKPDKEGGAVGPDTVGGADGAKAVGPDVDGPGTRGLVKALRLESSPISSLIRASVPSFWDANALGISSCRAPMSARIRLDSSSRRIFVDLSSDKTESSSVRATSSRVVRSVSAALSADVSFDSCSNRAKARSNCSSISFLSRSSRSGVGGAIKG
jgi:hypothetical protein